MKIIARAVQASFTVVAEDGTEIMALSYENASFSCDLATGLKAISDLAHQFKALDATHNTGTFVNPQGERERERVSVFERPADVKALINAASAFQNASARRELTDVQHDCCMEVYTALKLTRHDASAENVRELCKAANEFLASLGEPLSERETRYANKLREAIAAV